MPEFGDLMTLKKPREHLVALFGDRPLDFKPGEALVYNNSAYQGGNTFDVNQTLAIFERGGGRVTRLRLDTVGGHYPLKRKPTGSN